MTPEGKVKNAIKKFLRTVPDCWYFMPIGGPFTVHGVPDIVGVCGGKFFAIEVKAAGKLNNVTANQEACIAAINAAGGMAFVANTVEAVRARFVQAGWCSAGDY